MEKRFSTPKDLKTIDLSISKLRMSTIITRNVCLAGKILGLIRKKHQNQMWFINYFRRKSEQKQYLSPLFSEIDNCVRFKKEEYRIGSGVFLKSDVYAFPKNGNGEKNGETVS